MVWRIFLVSLVLSLAGLAKESRVADARQAFFESQVRPLLIERCYACHSDAEGARIKGGLRLDHRAGWEEGGDSGAAIIPGKVEESLLVRAVRYRDPDLQMPPKKKLVPEELAVIERWVAEGAFDPRELEVEVEVTAEADDEGGIDLATARDFWAFQKLVDPPVPAPMLASRSRGPLDAFLLEHWETRQAEPAGDASVSAIARRLTDALTGLPPAVLAYPVEDRPDAQERLVDRLLASPRYGERWGRHWLDVARYADSNGMDENMAYTEAYRYRDYVIDAFNADLPFDAFVIEQLAGDLLENSAYREKVATGFLAVGPKMLACDDPEKMRMDIVDEQIDTTGRAFLGMTFGCARCHDHKFDPISIRDYYGLAGIFKSTKTLTNYNVVAKWHEYDLSLPEVRAAHEEIERLRQRAEDQKVEESTRESAKLELRVLRAKTPPLTKVMGVAEDAVADVPVHLRGNHLTLGETVPRQIPVIFQGVDVGKPGDGQSGRLELARWIGAPTNPLTARVFANRLWRWHFGQGLVNSTENFGLLGSEPRHAALLDHLASELVRGDWSIKRLQRLLTTSSRYRLRSQGGVEVSEVDPYEVIPTYHPRQRLSAESVRDHLLGHADQLDFTMGGQLLNDESGSYVNRSRLDDYLEIPRRAVYMPVVRSALYDAFVAFDMADPSTPNGDRRDSVVSPQALYLMNSDLVHRAAAAVAKSLPEEVVEKRIDRLYQRLLNRSALAEEVERAQVFVENYMKEDGWAAFVRVIFASNEFLYLD